MQLLTPADAARRVTAALKTAAEATGAGFDYLLRTASRESSLNATAQNPTSSARGLFQFIDSTWLETMKEEGPKLGLGAAADDITKTTSGRYVVADPARRAEILAMRDEPQTSALMAAAFTRRNAATFENALGRTPTEGELYAAHFLGAQGAIELTSLAATSPATPAAAAFPAQASANRAVFYEGGRAVGARELYDRLTATSSGAAIGAVVGQGARDRSALALQSSGDGAASGPFNGGQENDGQTFHSLFKTGRRSPVASYVEQAWSSFGSAGLAADVSGTTNPAAKAVAYAPAGVTVPQRAEAAVAAVEQAVRTRPRKAAAPTQATPAPQPVASQAASAPQARAPEDKAAEAALQAGAATATRRKIELTTFLGFGAQNAPKSAPAALTTTARGRP